MKKTIMAVALAILILSLVLVGCTSKKDKDEAQSTSALNESTTIEVFTDADTGEAYVTNKAGEHIPVTTGIDGSLEFYEDLITKTGDTVSKEAESISEAKANSTAPATAPAGTTAASVTTTKSGSGSVEIETGNSGDIFDEDHAAVIDWG